MAMASAVVEVPRIKLGSQGLEVSAQGLGCMGMSYNYGARKPESDMIELIHHAIDSGVTFLDTSDVYGPHTNEILIGKALKEKGGLREKVQLATKFGISWTDGKMEIRGDPGYIRAACEASLNRMGIESIDLYYVHRIDTRVPIEGMDVCELDQALPKHSAVETPRSILGPAEKNNGTTRRSKTREVSSRYKSPTPSAASGPRRCPSPNTTRTATASSVSVPKRAMSAERKRPCTPPSPPSPSTPIQDTTAVIQLASRKLMGSRFPDALWPSTMRSLSVSFQSDNFSLPISKREKPVTHALSDRTLKSSSNVAHKQAETPPASRKPTPERKRSPLKGKNAPDQSENSKPVEGIHGRLVDQHRWPSRIVGRLSSSALAKSIDLADKTAKVSTAPNPVIPSLRRMSLPGYLSKPLHAKVELAPCSVDDNTLRKPKVVSSRSSERPKLVNPTGWSLSLPSPGSRPASPNKTSPVSASGSRGASPSRTKTLTSAPSRGSSPSRTRPSSPSRQSNISTSVLSYIADIRKGKKVANHIEDVHQLRLLYNRHLQWQYANAQADAALDSQKATAEKALCNVWRTTSELWESVTEKRIDLQQLTLKLKLYSVLNEQVAYLDKWPIIEKDHTCALSNAITDLQASTLRLPVTGGAMADINTVKAAVCSAVDVMQTMGSSLRAVLSRVEGMNCLVSELADVAARERATLAECEALLATTAAMQVEENSLRTHLVQLKQTWKSGEQQLNRL